MLTQVFDKKGAGYEIFAPAIEKALDDYNQKLVKWASNKFVTIKELNKFIKQLRTKLDDREKALILSLNFVTPEKLNAKFSDREKVLRTEFQNYIRKFSNDQHAAYLADLVVHLISLHPENKKQLFGRIEILPKLPQGMEKKIKWLTYAVIVLGGGLAIIFTLLLLKIGGVI
jgi:hypothetical protein